MAKRVDNLYANCLSGPRGGWYRVGTGLIMGWKLFSSAVSGILIRFIYKI